MPLYAKEPDGGSGSYKHPPEGTRPAICNMVVDLGMQETPYGTKHQVYIRWELVSDRPEVRIGDEPPATVSSTTLPAMSMRTCVGSGGRETRLRLWN